MGYYKRRGIETLGVTCFKELFAKGIELLLLFRSQVARISACHQEETTNFDKRRGEKLYPGPASGFV